VKRGKIKNLNSVIRMVRTMERTYIRTTTVVLIGLTVLLIAGCGNGSNPSSPVTQKEIKAQKKVITEYYQAINKKDYQKAYSLTSTNFKNGLSYPNFEFQYGNYLTSVQIKSMARLDQFSNKTSGAYDVSFDATYKKKYTNGDGKLPTVHVVQKEESQWKIDSIGIKNE
jgi:hypothetical protein